MADDAALDREWKPWLVTSRLALCGPRHADAASIYRIHYDPRTYEHDPAGRMETLPQAVDLAAAWNRHWTEHGFGYACVRLRAGAEVIGFAGIKRQAINGVEALNLYYRFAPAAWGAGLASEATQAIVTWAETDIQNSRWSPGRRSMTCALSG